MKKRVSAKQLIILLPFLVLVASPYLNKHIFSPWVKYLEFSYVQKQISHKEKSVDVLFEHFSQQGEDGLRQLAATYNLLFFVMDGEQKVFWNTDLLEPPFYYQEFYRPTFHSTANGSYLLFTSQSSTNSLRLIVAVPLQTHFEIENEYLQSTLALVPWLSQHVEITSPSSSQYVAKLGSGQYAFGISFLFEEVLGFYITLGLVCLLLLVYFSNKTLSKKKAVSPKVLVLAWLLFLYCWWWHTPALLFNTTLFSSQLFFGRIFHLTFGDLVVINFLLPLLFKINAPKRLAKPRLLLWKQLVFFLTATWAFWLIYELNFNAKIPLSISQLTNFNWYSLLSYLFLVLIGYLLLNEWKQLKTKWFKKAGSFIATTCFSAILVFGLVWLKLPFWYGLFPFLLHALVFVSLKKLSYSNPRLLQIGFISILFVWPLEHFHSIKLNADKHLVSTRLVKTDDTATEFILKSLEEQIVDDEYVINYFKSPIVFREVIKKRIEKVYLPPYLSRYNLDFHTHAFHRPSSADRVRLEKINELCNTAGVGISEHFYRIHDQSGLLHYAGVIPLYNSVKNEMLGYLGFELREKLAFDKSLYPELLLSINNDDNVLNEYHYASFLNHELKNGNIEGDISEERAAAIPSVHVQKVDERFVVYVWPKSLTFFQWFSAFGFFFTLLAVFVLLLKGLGLLRWSIKHKQTVSLP
ncbi:MAG: hypothetical protein KDC92_00050, partial [Bacteroidetes bacterium]|nr:hypothetical protein [Bacteroidota bacterium]